MNQREFSDLSDSLKRISYFRGKILSALQNKTKSKGWRLNSNHFSYSFRVINSSSRWRNCNGIILKLQHSLLFGKNIYKTVWCDGNLSWSDEIRAGRYNRKVSYRNVLNRRGKCMFKYTWLQESICERSYISKLVCVCLWLFMTTPPNWISPSNRTSLVFSRSSTFIMT